MDGSSHPPTGPETECASCHPQQVAEWDVSSHAYAMKDPVFQAMVKVGQHDTAGQLGDFCVKCHTPIGSATGATAVRKDPATGDFTQPFDGLPTDATDGVSCLVCHSITSIEDESNADFTMTRDGTRQGPIPNPDPCTAHQTAHSDLFEDSKLCGTCHVVVNPNDVALERTYIEWVQSDFNGFRSCQDCHMPSSTGPAAVGHPSRTLHDHVFAGVDVSLLSAPDFPGYAELRNRTEALLQGSVAFAAVVDPSTRRVGVTIQNLAGHALPTGATADRQMWIELLVRNDAGATVFESGTLDENGDLRVNDPTRTTRPGTDPSLVWYGQELFFAAPTDASTAPAPHPVDFLWEPNSETSHLIAVSETDPRSYDLSALAGGHYTASVRLLFRAFSPHVLQRLEQLGGLDPAVAARVPTVEMARTDLDFVLGPRTASTGGVDGG